MKLESLTLESVRRLSTSAINEALFNPELDAHTLTDPICGRPTPLRDILLTELKRRELLSLLDKGHGPLNWTGPLRLELKRMSDHQLDLAFTYIGHDEGRLGGGEYLVYDAIRDVRHSRDHNRERAERLRKEGTR